MVPKSRYRQEVERAAGRRNAGWEEQATVVPMEDRVGDYSEELTHVHGEDVEISEQIPLSPPVVANDATVKTPLPKARPDAPTLHDTEGQGRRASFDDEETRIEPGMTAEETLEITSFVEIHEADEDPQATKLHVAPGRAPAPRREESVLFRLAKSVVTAVPRAIKRAIDRTGQHKLPKAAPSEPAVALEPRTIDQRSWREMRTAPIFDGLPNEALRDALLTGEASVHYLGRDEFVPMDGSLGLVRSGQVAVGLFGEDVLECERKHADEAKKGGDKAQKRERKRRFEVGPLISLADRNLATFEEGDVVETAIGSDRHARLACFTTTPAAVIVLSRARADLWRRIYPFLADRFRRASQSARARLDATDGARALVADFFIRHGLSVSLTLRVRKLDSCIECYACEKACEDRYGVKRLSLNGRVLGGLDFVDACHTCTDQRCIDPCNFDAITFDAVRKEVLINEANCTGCTLCALACPYDAIEMHELVDAPKLVLRLDREKKLGFGEGTGRKAKLRRIASKCDHCAYYEDQACISACPTGALLEVLPSDVVSQLPDQARQSAKAGFDRTAAINVNQLNQTNAFVKGLEIPELGRARAPRTKVLIGLWWGVGLLAVLLGLVEIGLRLFAPAHSAQLWYMTVIEGIDPEIAIHRVGYRPGCELAVNFGYIGTALMISGLAYVWRRRFSFARRWGSLRAWFDWHVMTGVVGPLFILMHSVAKLDNWVSIAFWSMVLTVISGLLGRYLTTELPERASKAMVETLEVDRQLAALREQHPAVRGVDQWFETYRRRVAAFERRLHGNSKDKAKHGKPTLWGAILTFFFVVWDNLGYGRRLRQLKRQLRRQLAGGQARRIRKEALRLAGRLVLLERRRVLMPRLEPLFRQWKAVHIPMSIVLSIVGGIHIVLALAAG